jgi:hypothetical protein
MKNGLLYSLLAILCFSSCEKGYDEMTTKVTESPAEELNPTLLTGRVTNTDGAAVANATVQMYHDGKLHETTADTDGRYEYALPRDGSRVNISAQSDEYDVAEQKVMVLETDAAEKNIIMTESASIPLDLEASSITDTLIQITGRLLYEDGTAVANAYMIMISSSDFAASFQTFGVTDANGDFEFAVPKTAEPRQLIAYQECQSAIALNAVGAYTVDLDIGTFTTNWIPGARYNFTGFVTDCNAPEGLPSGEITFTFQDGTTARAEITDGAYQVDVEDCGVGDCVDVSIRSNFAQGTFEQECIELTDTEMVLDFETCFDPLNLDGEAVIVIDADTLLFDEAQFEYNQTTDRYLVAGISSADNLLLLIVMNKSDTGVYSVREFFISNSNQEAIFYKQPADEISLDVTADDDRFVANISGDVVNASQGISQSMAGTIDVVKL